MNIVLVFPPFYLESLYNLPPLGLVHLATTLKNMGHTVHVLDFVLALRQGNLQLDATIYDQCTTAILDYYPDIVGFSSQCTTYPGVIQIAKRIKAKNTHLPIVLGGHNASFLDRVTLEQFPWIDAVIRGEGEVTLSELIQVYEQGGQGEGVQGVTWREKGRIVQNPERELIEDLDALPFPEYALLPPLGVYRDACGLPRSIAILEVGRGCPHQCVYCSQSRMWRRKQRVYSVDRLIQEMSHLRDVHGAECFVLAYDQFTSNKSFVRAFCHRLLEQGLETIPWYCISRLDTVNSQDLALMRQAGCESMCYGIDSGSQKTLDFIHKHIDRDILYQRVRETTDLGMTPTLSFIVGFPEEEQEDIDATLILALMTGIQGKSAPLIQMPTVLPGTELHARYHTMLTREVDTYFALGMEFSQGKRLESDERLINTFPDIFSSFYNLPCPAMSLQDLGLITEIFPLIVLTYPMSFFLMVRSLEKSPTQCFFEWLHWAKESNHCDDLMTAGKNCLHLFPNFVIKCIHNELTASFGHLQDLLRYETILFEAGSRSILPKGTDQESEDNLCHQYPIRNEGVQVQEFSYHLPTILADLKQEVVREFYSEESSILVFLPQESGCQVHEINAFGRDFLNLSDGQATVREVAVQLYDLYAESLDFETFMSSCENSASLLAREQCIYLKA